MKIVRLLKQAVLIATTVIQRVKLARAKITGYYGSQNISNNNSELNVNINRD